MRRILLLLLLLLLGFVLPLQTQAPVPKPDPEFRKLQPLVAEWSYHGEYKPGSWGPGRKVTGKYIYRFILNDFVLEGRRTETAATGESSQVLEIDAYDPIARKITSDVFPDDGSRFSGIITVVGNTITWEGKIFIAGKQYMLKEPFVLSADGRTGTSKGELSTDGNTWAPSFEGTFTKVKPLSPK